MEQRVISIVACCQCEALSACRSSPPISQQRILNNSKRLLTTPGFNTSMKFRSIWLALRGRFGRGICELVKIMLSGGALPSEVLHSMLLPASCSEMIRRSQQSQLCSAAQIKSGPRRDAVTTLRSYLMATTKLQQC